MAVELTADEVATLNDYGTRIAQLNKDIQKAQRAGLDVSALQQNVARIDAVRKGLLKEFAPSPSSSK